MPRDWQEVAHTRNPWLGFRPVRVWAAPAVADFPAATRLIRKEKFYATKPFASKLLWIYRIHIPDHTHPMHSLTHPHDLPAPLGRINARPDHRAPSPTIHRSAFSLIEVVLALGVLTFSFLVLFNMIPVGLGMLSGSIDATVGMQIVQRVTTVARQAKFSELAKLDRNPGTDSRGEKADFFFDDQGNEVANANDLKCVYTAAVVLLPVSKVPGAVGAQVANPNIATINILIKKNAGTETLRVVNALIANNGL